ASGAGQALRHQVDAFGGAAYEDNLAAGGRIDEAPHGVARGLIAGGGAFAEAVDGAVDVGVIVLVEVGYGIEHRPRLLRGGGIVEVGEPGAEQGELGPNGFDVVDFGRDLAR